MPQPLRPAAFIILARLVTITGNFDLSPRFHTMLSDFTEYLFDVLQINKTDPILLAVSGGLDSTAMAHLFHEAGLNYGIAHCNFQLRGKDSDEDENFVRQLASRLNVPFFSTRFDTTAFSEENKISVQEAARNLRYRWLHETAEGNGFCWIATAHHQDDSVETMLFNLIKGCGIRGLHGILPKQNKVIRPLMFTGREALEAWVKSKGISWREDASNAIAKYDRNKIRLNVIPEIEKINPSFKKTALASIQRFAEAQEIIDVFVARLKDEAFEMKDGRLCLRKSAFTFGNANRTLLYELLAPYGFNNQQTEQMLSRFDAPPGGIFYSPTYQVLNDRSYLILLPNKTRQKEEEYEIGEGMRQLEVPEGVFHFEKSNEVPTEFSKDPNVAWFDARKLQFPLRLRRWKAGDRFQPLGMGGRSKKVQDLLSDSKLSRFDKERVWILESQGRICWVVGHRTDERFKIDESTKSSLRISWLPGSFAERHQPSNHFHKRKS